MNVEVMIGPMTVTSSLTSTTLLEATKDDVSSEQLALLSVDKLTAVQTMLVQVGENSFQENPKAQPSNNCLSRGVSAPLNNMETTNSALRRPKILLLGDSLTQISWDGWVGGLAHRYQRRADVVNRGLSGYNTRWYLLYAEAEDVWKEPGSVALTVIFFGANDASLEKYNPRQHVPLPEYQANLKALVDKTKESFPSSKILLITPPPVHHLQRFAFQKQRYGDKATGALERNLETAGIYANACKEVARSLNLPVVDLYTSMTAVGDFGPFFYDGLHFSDEGQDFVLKEVLETISTHFPALHVKPDPDNLQPNNSGSSCEGIPSSGPYHDHIDHTNPAASFRHA
eukprot:Nitzschia sp. Nitz4//scaffold88_size82704//39945//41126//NITZ4_005293-RA/size82704-processed-gene-0.67-mRNA-1//-1//CDS//3329559497//5902//frame0